MSKIVNTKILLRNDSSHNWANNNPTLSKGQVGIQIDTKKFKFGDGFTEWNRLPYGAGADIPLATNLVDGLLTKEMYTKLYNIEERAQVNVQSDWNAQSGDAAILNKPTTLAGYGITDAMTATAIQELVNNAISSAFTYKGTKNTVANLPQNGNKVGDIWHVVQNGGEYVWNGSAWEELGSVIDLSSYMQTVSIAGITLTSLNYTITAEQLKTALGLGTAAFKNIATTIDSETPDDAIPTAAAMAEYVAENGTKVEASTTNGNILVDGVETKVYELPDTFLFDCGNATTNYS